MFLPGVVLNENVPFGKLGQHGLVDTKDDADGSSD